MALPTTTSYIALTVNPQPDRPYEPTPLRERPRVEWGRAWRGVRALVEDSGRTDQAFEVISALEGMSAERLFRGFARDPRARSLLIERRSLIAALSRFEQLEALPPGSLGRSYLEFMRTQGFRPSDLVKADEGRPGHVETGDKEPDRDWFFTRFRDLHDLIHVLTGYGCDEAGEIANLAFTYGQFRTGGVLLLVVVGALLGLPFGGPRWLAYLYAAYRRGRRAVLLPLEPFEDWLGRPLDEVRREVRIEPPEIAHPRGVYLGGRAQGSLGRVGGAAGVA